MAQAVISNGDLGFPKVRVPSFLMALTEQSLEKYGRNLPEDTVILVDSSLEIPEWLAARKYYKAPILQSAIEQVGKAQTANIVSVAVVNKLLDLVPPEVLKEAVAARIPKGSGHEPAVKPTAAGPGYRGGARYGTTTENACPDRQARPGRP